MNSAEIETKLRKYRNNIKISAYGTVVLGAWNFLKCVLYLVMDTRFFDRMMGLFDYSYDNEKTIIATSFVLLSIDLLVRVLISRSAISEIKGKRKKNGKKRGSAYIVFGIIMAVSYSIMDISNLSFIAQITDIDLIIDQIVTTLVDITSIYAVCDLIYCVIRFRILSRKLEQLQGQSQTLPQETEATDTNEGGECDAG